MDRSFYFILVFCINAVFTALSYSSFRESRYGVAAAMAIGSITAALWILTARQIGCSKTLMATGMMADLAGKAAGFAIPILFFGVKFKMGTAVGMAMIVGGILVL